MAIKLTKQQKQAISTIARVSVRTVENWMNSKPELIKILLAHIEKEEGVKDGDYIVISSTFFDDNMQRGYKVKNKDNRLCVVHNDGEITYLDELPSWLYVKMDKTQFESDDKVKSLVEPKRTASKSVSYPLFKTQPYKNSC